MNTVITKLIPIFLLALLGFLAGKTKLLPDNTSEALCSFLFYFSAPAVSFSNIISSDLESIFNLRFALSLIVFEIFTFSILMLFYNKFFRFTGKDMVIHSVCSFYGNISYVGIPVFLTLFNNVIPNIITILVHGVFTFPLVVFFLDWFSGKQSNRQYSQIILNTLKNPNIFIPAIGAFLLLLKINVPQVIVDSAELLGRPTTAAGMFALGLTCSQTGEHTFSRKTILNALVSAVIKLIICPVIAWSIGKYIFKLDQWWLTSLVIISMLPAALNDYILSQRYHSDESFASLSVLFSNLLFSITISLYIFFNGL